MKSATRSDRPLPERLEGGASSLDFVGILSLKVRARTHAYGSDIQHFYNYGNLFFFCPITNKINYKKL